MKEKTQHHEFFKQFKDKGDLVEYMKTHTPESEKRPFDTPGMCCGWCERPIESGVEIGKNTYSALCPKCFEYSAAWNKEKGTKY
jgi:hypothetical protein